MEQPEYRCSFCDKSQHDVRRMITGDRANICDECVDICVDTLKDYPEEPTVEAVPGEAVGSIVPCALCSMPAPASEVLYVESRGALCTGCVGAIQAALPA